VISKRHEKVGIQRELHQDWFNFAASLYTKGISKQVARKEIYSYLDASTGSGTPQSEQSKTYIANALIKTWVAPEKELVDLRDAAGKLLSKTSPKVHQAIHWSLLGAAYPFWFNVAFRVGRLLNLQDSVTQGQVVLRLKEVYGDRQTVSRRARYVLRSFVTWGMLKDSGTSGCYEKVSPVTIPNWELEVFMIEATLHSIPDGTGEVSTLLNSPALFPYTLPSLSGEFIAQNNPRIDVVRYGLDQEMLKIRLL
jgi:hypothetical protein